jgi:hypothetical protein
VTDPEGRRVTYAGEPNGLASMLGTLIEQNLARDPGRRRLLRPAVVSLVATDADVGVTLRIEPTGVEVASAPDPRAHLEVRTDSHRLLDLAAVPLRWGLPDPLTAPGRRVTRALLAGRLRVRGLVRHPLRLMRLNRLLSAA